ncbi:MAG: triphosphoribosyl-dephospho-CoA synthase CitG [Selenomonadaceae bacterium]|nr:triphosphoribosyl-dephospho-CoA synthase CitG [Selenomonadaceae bacterium]
MESIGALAVEAMLYEVSATPKPGLVDRRNNGAHEDMDFFTFMSSAAALRKAFDEFAVIGKAHGSEPIENLLPHLQETGISAEREMFRMTRRVNTHKGMIFSLGILTGAAGWALLRKEPLTAEHLGHLSAAMCNGICSKAYAGTAQKTHLTKGEAMYLKYGVTGARGEAESGFRTVREVALPAYRELRAEGLDINDVLVGTLLHIMANSIDTNILGRHDMETMHYVQRSSAAALEKGGVRTAEGRNAIDAMDEDFTARWISPGGCADLLAVAHFLYEAEKNS